MRALPILAVVLAIPAVAHADGFFEFLGGVSIPAGDSDWTKNAQTSPKLEGRAGSVTANGVGGMLQADWTPVNLANGSFGLADVAAHRFRVLADIAVQKPIAPRLIASARVGAGIDIAHASATVTILGTTAHSSDTDVGFAFELGGGLWYDVGGAQLGGELAVPIGHHAKQGNGTDGNYTFDYTSYDVDLLVGVRLLSR